MGLKDQLTKATDLMPRQARLVVLTGAGISVDSGLPDFRGPSGLWEKFDPRDITIERFINNPALYWERVSPLGKKLERAKPNAAHRALVKLEKSQYFSSFTIITQNVDNLHQAAGSKKVIELHGTYLTASCMQCGAKTSYKSIKYQLRQNNSIAFCDRCMFGLLKSDAILFGEPLPRRAILEAEESVLQADIMLIIGTSLEVYPAAALPIKAKNNGARLIGVNTVSDCHDQMEEFEIDVCLAGRAAKIVPRLVKAILLAK
ncbi:MAG: NAD-dependent deacetylase [Candidatus Hermodarchaeota archaeon]